MIIIICSGGRGRTPGNRGLLASRHGPRRRGRGLRNDINNNDDNDDNDNDNDNDDNNNNNNKH